MTVTLTYEDALSRVKVLANGFDAGATLAQVQRSLDQVTWTDVRCGVDAPVVSGAVTVYDYEFAADVVNYYRVVTPRDASFLAAGTTAHGNNTSLVPALPAVHAAGDVIYVYAAIHNVGTGFPNTPTGYTLLASNGNARLFGKVDGGAEAAPTVSFSNGVAGPVSAKTAAFRNVQLAVDAFATTSNGVQRNVNYPALTPLTLRSVLFFNGWKRSNWSSVNTLVVPGGTAAEITEGTTFQAGIGQGICWDWVQQTTLTAVPAGQFVVTGGPDEVGSGMTVAIPVTTQTQTGSITPTLDAVWLKSIASPFLNRSFDCVPRITPITRDARQGIFEVVGRSFPVAVTDLRASREVTVDVITRTTQEHVDLDFVLALGDVMFVHTPSDHPLPTMHVAIGQTTERRPLLTRPCGDDWRVFTLPLREVAPPGPDVCGSTITWQGVLNTYATWSAVLAGETSWFDLLQNVGSPADVIVP